MAEKTIPQLDPLPDFSDITDQSMFALDTGLHTFKVLWSQIMEKLNASMSSVPTGTISAFAGDVSPEGYALCNGQTLDRGANAKLFSVIGTRFGEGDGSTTFHVPDFRGLFLRGQNSGSGKDPDSSSRFAMNTGGAVGDNVGSMQGHAFQTHTHVQNAHNHIDGACHTSGINAGAFAYGNSVDSGYNPALTGVSSTSEFNRRKAISSSTTATNQNASASGLTAQATTNETRPINAYVNYIIKL